MLCKILKPNGHLLYNTSSHHLTRDEEKHHVMVRRVETCDITIKKKLGRGVSEEDLVKDPEFADYITPMYDPYEDDDACPPPGIMRDIDYSDDEDSHEQEEEKDDEADVDTYEQYVGAHVQLHVGGKMMGEKVTGRKREFDGYVRDKASTNPIMD
jgi:hypothetical protein